MPEARAFDLATGHFDIVAQQRTHQRIVARRDQGEFRAFVWCGGQLIALDFHFFDFVGFDFGHEFTVAHLGHFAFV